jgi:hypothetical protein
MQNIGSWTWNIAQSRHLLPVFNTVLWTDVRQFVIQTVAKFDVQDRR